MKDQSVIVKAFEFLFPYHFSFIQYESVRSRTSVRYESMNRYECWRDALGVVCGRGRTVRCCDVLLCEVAGK